jgi:HEPN domain-containing protein
MSDTDALQAWIEKAEEDFVLARSALRRKKPLTYGACFHAQQCAEKYLKALLVARGQTFPKTHDLVLLSDLCAQTGLLVGVPTKQLNTLSDQAVRVRYPGAAPTPAEAREAVETAKTVRTFARKLLGVKPQAKNRK